MKDAHELACDLQATANDLVAATGTTVAKVENVKPRFSPVIQKLADLPDKTKATRGGRPLAVIQTRNGPRGVFWKGEGKGDSGPTVGVRKIKLNGGLYSGGKFSGTFFISLADLQGEGRNG